MTTSPEAAAERFAATMKAADDCIVLLLQLPADDRVHAIATVLAELGVNDALFVLKVAKLMQRALNG